MAKYGNGIVVRFGAAHNSISANGDTYDMASVDVDQRKANERHARNLMHDIGMGLFGKPGADKRRQRRQRKGYAHA